MSKLMSFDRLADAKQIIKNGIKADNRYAKYDIKEAIWYYVNHTTYSDKQILERMVKCTDNYFAELPLEQSVEHILKKIIEQAKENRRKAQAQGFDADTDEQSNIIVYKEELDQLEILDHPDTRRLAFAFLVYSKYLGYPEIFECNADLCKVAWRYGYDNNQRIVTDIHSRSLRVNGTTTRNRLEDLTKAGIIIFKAEPNPRYKVKKDQKPSWLKCEILVLQKEGTEAINIRNLTEESLVLWYDRYCEYTNIVDCSLCGAPVFRTSNSLKYCPKCALKAKRGICA